MSIIEIIPELFVCLLLAPGPRTEGGIFAPTTEAERAKGARPLRVCSLGGGPGYELLAYDWFARCVFDTSI